MAAGQRFLGLDGLRGVAAFVVVLLHGTLTFNIGYVPSAACMAVDFFFLLSGFVIAYAYDERLGSHRMTWRQFFGARMIRLYPMLFVGTVASELLFVRSQIHGHQLSGPASLLITTGSFVLLPLGLAVGTVAYIQSTSPPGRCSSNLPSMPFMAAASEESAGEVLQGSLLLRQSP